MLSRRAALRFESSQATPSFAPGFGQAAAPRESLLFVCSDRGMVFKQKGSYIAGYMILYVMILYDICVFAAPRRGGFSLRQRHGYGLTRRVVNHMWTESVDRVVCWLCSEVFWLRGLGWSGNCVFRQ